MSVMYKCYSVSIDRGIITNGRGKEVVDELNDVDKRYIYQFMTHVQLPGTKRFGYQIKIHTEKQSNYVSLAQEFQQHLTK